MCSSNHDVSAELILAESGTACASLAGAPDITDQAQQQLTQQGHTQPQVPFGDKSQVGSWEELHKLGYSTKCRVRTK